MFGDNQSVVTSSTIPHSVLSKRHNCLAFHRVRECVAADIIRFYHIKGTLNPSDIMSKHCGYPQAWPIIRPLLFWAGDITKMPPLKDDEDVACDEGECQRYNSPTSIHDVINPTAGVSTGKKAVRSVRWSDSTTHSTSTYGTSHSQINTANGIGVNTPHDNERTVLYRRMMSSPHVV